MSKHTPQNILITGGAGFIGANLVHHILANPEFTGTIVNVDKLTYAGNIHNLAAIDENPALRGRHRFVRADICDHTTMRQVMSHHHIDTVIHLAAESHVDRSIDAPAVFLQTNIMGTFTLLEVCRELWEGRQDVRFHHVSTDEVFGALGATGLFTEETAYDPKSPYSASKASSDHLVRAYHNTFGLNYTLSNCSNNYGPYQFPEKLIPLMIMNMLEGKPLPVYGEGKNIRDWLYVTDHAEAIWHIVTRGKNGESYNIGGNEERENITLVRHLCHLMEEALHKPEGTFESLITFVTDRKGHDLRYAIDAGKIKRELGWEPSVTFEQGLSRTIAWYLNNRPWIEKIQNGAYQKAAPPYGEAP